MSMKRYALLENGVVTRVVAQDSPPELAGQWVDITGKYAGPGFSYAGGVFFAPPPPAARSKITKFAFRSRFTQAEKAAIEMASIDDPSAAPALRLLAAGLRANMADTRDAQFINLARSDTRAGVQQLESVGILAAGRAAVILDAPITDEESAE
jgi:hypothetical protein